MNKYAHLPIRKKKTDTKWDKIMHYVHQKRHQKKKRFTAIRVRSPALCWLRRVQPLHANIPQIYTMIILFDVANYLHFLSTLFFYCYVKIKMEKMVANIGFVFFFMVDLLNWFLPTCRCFFLR